MSESLSSVMSGQGYYNRHSRTQAAAMAFAFPFLEAAARQAALPAEGRDFHVADLGSATGANSLQPLRLALSLLRERQAEPFPIRVTHTDQAGNDFSALFQLLQQDPRSYLRGLGEIYPYAIGRSFFERLFPEQALDLAWSSIAVHWMSRVPVPLKNHIWSSFARGEEQAAFAAQARRDWEDFLRCRALELKPGAPLVLVGGASDDSGKTGGEPLMEVANRVLQAMVAAGRLAREEYEAFTIPIYSRKQEEFLAPFAQPPFRDWYRIIGERLDFSPDAQCVQYQQDGDEEQFANNLTGFLRAFTEPLFLAALSPNRAAAEKSALGEEFYRDFREAARQDLKSLQFGWYVCSLHLQRSTFR